MNEQHELSDTIMSCPFFCPGLNCVVQEKIRHNILFAKPAISTTYIHTLCLQKKTSSQELYLCSHTGEPWTIRLILEMLHFSPQSLLGNNNNKRKAMSNNHSKLTNLRIMQFSFDIQSADIKEILLIRRSFTRKTRTKYQAKMEGELLPLKTKKKTKL